MEELAKRLKQLRLERELTMEQLVADMNFKYQFERPLSRSMVSRWESGSVDPSLDNAKYLSQYFDVSLDYLIGLTDTRTPSRILAYAKKTKEGRDEHREVKVGII